MRVKFPEGKQRAFLQAVQRATGRNSVSLAKGVGISTRTIRDWQREKWNMSEQAVHRLCRVAHLRRPVGMTVLPEFWSVEKAARLGGKRRVALHGPLGTPESRRKGGLTMMAKIRTHPELWRRRGFVLRKTITKPAPSKLLAEFIGIMLGDGGVRNSWQIAVSYNGREDQEYAVWLYRLIQRLFSVTPAYLVRKEIGAADLVVSSTALVDFLVGLGIPRGHKLRHGLAIPRWIMDNLRYRLVCLRGLMDTDGSVYAHRYRVNGTAYQYVKLCFSSASPALLNDVDQILKEAGYSPRLHNRCVYLERSSDVDRYFAEVGTHNPRYLQRYQNARRYRGRLSEQDLERCESGRFERTANALRGQKPLPGFKSQPLRFDVRQMAGM